MQSHAGSSGSGPRGPGARPARPRAAPRHQARGVPQPRPERQRSGQGSVAGKVVDELVVVPVAVEAGRAAQPPQRAQAQPSLYLAHFCATVSAGAPPTPDSESESKSESIVSPRLTLKSFASPAMRA